MNTHIPDPIRILLVDDDPRELINSNVQPERPAVRYVFTDSSTEEEERWFDLRWLATAGECREFMDLTRLLDRQNVSTGDKNVWVPDILIIDYSLSKRVEPVEERLKADQALLARLSPLPSLRIQAKELGLQQSAVAEYGFQIKEHENSGCFAGGLMLALFADHPSAPVTVTIRTEEQLRGTNTGFFQWLLAGVSAGQLQAAGKFGKDWKNLIECGVKRLRERIEQLEDVNLVMLSMDDFSEMIQPSSHENKSLKMWSKYGLRRLPLKVLFLDFPEAEREKEIIRWASARLKARVKRAGFGGNVDTATIELQQGIDWARKLWHAYDTDIRLRRERLEELALQAKTNSLTEAELREYKAEMDYFDVSQTGECARHVWSIRKAIDDGLPHRAVRWAVLFLMLRLFARMANATIKLQQRFAAEGFSDAPTPSFAVKAEDVYLTLYPSPSEYRDPSSFWSKDLIKLGSQERSEVPKRTKNSVEKNLGLSISDVLNGKQWVADAATPIESWAFGLIPNEEQILKVYALLEAGLEKSDNSPFLNRVFGGQSTI